MNSQSAPDWPDWGGQTAIVIGTGPSAEDCPLDAAEGRARAFAVKSAWRLAPWADAVYGLDRGWWIATRGAEGFVGRKFSPSPIVANLYRDVRLVRLRPFAKILVGETGTVGCGLRSGGGHSGFQALNLAVQFGAHRILLVGFDMTLANGAHWSRYDETARPDVRRCAAWREALDDCADQFRELGVEVVNCAPRSALTAYPKVPLAEALTWL